MFLDYLETGKTSAIGTCTGAIAGLAAITPAAGSVGPLGGIIIGTLMYGIVAQLTGSMRNSTIFLGLFFVIGIFLLTRVNKKS